MFGAGIRPGQDCSNPGLLISKRMESKMRGIPSAAGMSYGLATLVVGLGLALAPATQAAKEGAAEPPARFTMSPAEGGGFVRLDTTTGQMSLCTRKDSQWQCSDMADQGRGLAEEVERLRTENKDLKAEIRRIEDIMLDGNKSAGRGGSAPPGGSDADRRAEAPAGKYGLPSEKDVDQAIDYMERMFRKFRDKMKEFETDNKGTPL